MNNLNSFVSRLVVGVVTAFAPASALAQAAPPAGEAPAPAPVAPPPVAEVPPAPPPVMEAPPAPPPAPLPPMEAAPPMEPPEVPVPSPLPEEKKEEDIFKITTGAGFRSAVRLQSYDDPEKLDDISVDELNLELRFSGKVTKVVGWTGNLTIDGRTPATVGPVQFEAQAMDVIGQLDFMDEFHIWLGRMLTPSDRTNFSGSWFSSPWNYAGAFTGVTNQFAYVGPRGTEEIGREVGAVVWGNDKSGKIKYFAGVMDLDNPELTPLFTGRLNLAIIGDEPGFYSSSTYYGSKDILAIGIAGQYQKRSVLDNEATMDVDETEDGKKLAEFNADILAEFNVGTAGTLSGEVGYYYFDGPKAVFPVEHFVYAMASYLTPNEIGIGKIQPLFRIQKTFDRDISAYEGAVSYIMKDYFAKLTAVYTYTDLGDDLTGNMVQLAFQIQQ